EQRRQRLVVLAREQIGGRQDGGLQAGPRRGGQAVGGDRGLARSDVPLQQPQHGRRSAEIGPDVVDGGGLIGRQRDGAPVPARQRIRQRGSQRLVAPVVEDDRPCSIEATLPAPADHTQLQGQQLAEGQPAERVVAALEGRRVV